MNRRAPLGALLAANTLAMTATSVTLVAVPWFVLVTTGSATLTGLVAACELVPLVVAMALGGPVVDRIGRRRAVIVSDLASGAAFGAVPLLHAAIGLALWQLCALVAIGGLARGPGATARKVMLRTLAEHAGTPLERATSAYDGLSRTGQMLGAPAAGLLIALTGPADALLATAGSFLVSAVAVAAFIPRTPAAPTGSRYLADLREGGRYVLRDRLVRSIVLLVMVSNMLDQGFSAVLVPVYAREVLASPTGLGAVFAALAAGGLVGTVVFGVLGPRLRLWPVFAAAAVVSGGPRFVLFAVTDELPVVLVGVFLAGAAGGALNPILATVLLRRVPDELQTRVFGVLGAGVFAAMPVGALAAGGLIDTIGLSGALVAMGAAYLLATLCTLLFPVWRAMDKRSALVSG